MSKQKNSLRKYLSQNIPVIVQWTPHTVLAYGYEYDGNTIIIHNPGDPRAKLMPKTQWMQNKHDVSVWLREPYLWQYRQFQMVVVRPKTKEQKIEWKGIWERAAQKTLGVATGDYPNYSGIKGLQTLSQSIEKHFGQDEQKFRQTLHNFKTTFELGVGFRRNASAFIAGYAAATNDTNLSSAARCFRTSAHLFRKGENLLKWSREHQEEQSQVEKEIVGIIKQIIKNEEAAANFLLKVSE